MRLELDPGVVEEDDDPPSLRLPVCVVLDP